MEIIDPTEGNGLIDASFQVLSDKALSDKLISDKSMSDKALSEVREKLLKIFPQHEGKDAKLYCLFFEKSSVPVLRGDKIVWLETADRDILKALGYIRQHLGEKMEREAIAAHCFLSSGSLSTRFKKLTGHSLMDYVKAYQIICARFMLSYTDYMINEIAGITGHNDPSNFGFHFAKRCRMTPRDFRRYAEPDVIPESAVYRILQKFGSRLIERL